MSCIWSVKNIYKNKEWRDYENAIKNLKKIFIKFKKNFKALVTEVCSPEEESDAVLSCKILQ